jgi:PAS domain S-box-containing protein
VIDLIHENHKPKQSMAEQQEAGEARERLAAIVDSSDDAVISKDLNGTINAWNRGAEKIFGYAAEEVLGKPMLMLFPPERMNEEAEILERIRRGESVKHFETVRVRKDGTRIDISATISPIKDGRGAIVGASKIARDITERKRANSLLAEQSDELSRQAEELQRSQHALEGQKLMLQSVLDSISEGVVAADQTGKFILWNPAATRMIGLGAADVPPAQWTNHYGTYLTDMVTPLPPEQNPLLRAICGEACTAELYVRNAQLESGVWIESSASPLRGKDGVVMGGVVALRDVTQKKADQRKQEQYTDELRRSNAELEQFAYIASHDLQEPLRMVASYAELLGERYRGKLDQQADLYLNYAVEGAKRMQSLIHDLLAYARVTSQAKPFEPTDSSLVVADVMKRLRGAIERSQAEIVCGNLPVVNADEVQLGQVFQNLIANAIKFHGDGPPHIEIRAHAKGKMWNFAVADDGIGIAKEGSDRIFQMFQRLHSRGKYEGSGIGLAISKRIIERHQGNIWFDSIPGKGTTFHFTIPKDGEAQWQK